MFKAARQESEPVGRSGVVWAMSLAVLRTRVNQKEPRPEYRREEAR
jgi:hypothetical protein